MKLVLIIAIIIIVEFIVGLFAVSHAVAAKHEPPALIFKRRITVIYNVLFNRRTN
ncbi:hypothetical protein [Ruminococcus sp. HUN007]|uniref:hypothetical protein n=1 Tax=Ruminococcus sp. HUN007 TaxID=1514668 RepID=UPI0012DEC105|nr:hypothetical protein [Ruminococcus sp. HUN007]